MSSRSSHDKSTYSRFLVYYIYTVEDEETGDASGKTRMKECEGVIDCTRQRDKQALQLYVQFIEVI